MRRFYDYKAREGSRGREEEEEEDMGEEEEN